MTTIDGYDLDTINIVLYNNIDRNKPIDLDNKMFVFDQPIKSDNGKMWICTNVRYSEEVLMTKTHAECVQVFFDQALFLKYIKESSIKKPKNTQDDMKKHAADMWENSENNKKCKLTHNCFMKENMLILIKYCFPATFPVSNPPFSFSSGQKNVITFTSYINSWFNVDKYANFTHMKIDGKEATVIGCQWLDTVKFHPAYQKVNKGIKQYFAKLKKPLSDLLKQVIDLMDKNDSFKKLATIYLKWYSAIGNNNTKRYEGANNFLDFFYNNFKANIIANSPAHFDSDTFKDTCTTILNELDKNVGYKEIYVLFSLFYYFYYTINLIDEDKEGVKKFIITNKLLKQKLDLIMLLCCVFSKDGYNQFVREIGIDQVTLQKYDFHKPYIQLFESLNIPNRQSTNPNINKLFDIIDYDIPGLYNIYSEDGFYNVANNKTQDTYIGIDRINLSADKKKAPHYEIYLAMEFVGGRVDDNNRSAISCLFENNRLGRLLEKNIKKEKESDDILEMREYIDLSEIIKKTEKDIKQKEAQEAKEAKEAKVAKKENEVREAQAVAPQNPEPQGQGSKNDLLEVELDKVPGISSDIRKKIMEKINKDIPEVKELAKVISKYNKDVSVKSDYTKILTTTKSKIKSLIENAKYDQEQNKALTPDEKERARYDLIDYEKIKELIIQLIDQTFFEENKDNAKKFNGGSLKGLIKGGLLKGLIKSGYLRKTRRKRYHRRNIKTHRLTR